MVMKTQLLNEVNRVREIMGLTLILEVSLPKSLTQKILKNLFDIDALKNMDLQKLGRTVRESLLSASSESVETNLVNKIISAIKYEKWGDDILNEVPLEEMFKNLIKNSDVTLRKEIETVMRGTLRQIYPDLSELADDCSKLVTKLTTTIAKKDAVLYQDALNALKNLKKEINDLKGIDEEYKKILIDVFKLNDLPDNIETVKFITQNRNFLRDKISELFLTNYGPVRGSTDILSNGTTFTVQEFEQLKKFIDKKIAFNDLPESLLSKIIPALKKNSEFVNEYFKNLLKKLGYVNSAGEVNIPAFLKSIMLKTSKNKEWDSVVKEEISDFDYNIVDEILVKEFENIAKVYKLASQLPFDKIEGLQKAIEGLKTLGSLEGPNFLKYLLENVVTRIKLMTPYGTLEELYQRLDREVQLMAKKIIGDEKGPKTIVGNLDTIKNLMVLLNKSDISGKSAASWLENNLLSYGLEKESAEFKRLIESPEFKELADSLSVDFQKNFGKAVKIMFRGYGEMTGILNINRWKELFLTEGKVNKLKVGSYFFGDFLKSWGRFALTTSPNSVDVYRKIFALGGRSGIYVERGFKLLVWTTLAYPWLASLGTGGLENAQRLEALKNFEDFKKLICEPTVVDGETIEKIGTDEECKEINDLLQKLYVAPNPDEIEESYRPTLIRAGLDMAGIVTETYVDDIQFWSDKIWRVMIGGGGAPEAKTIALNELMKQIDATKKKYDKMLQEDYCFVAKNGKSAEVNMYNCLMNKRKQKTAEKELNKIDGTPKGFENWARINGYTIATPYNETGVGKAYKNDDTNKTIVNFIYKNNTFIPY